MDCSQEWSAVSMARRCRALLGCSGCLGQVGAIGDEPTKRHCGPSELAYNGSCGGQAAIPIQRLITQAIEPVGQRIPERFGHWPIGSHDFETDAAEHLRVLHHIGFFVPLSSFWRPAT